MLSEKVGVVGDDKNVEMQNEEAGVGESAAAEEPSSMEDILAQIEKYVKLESNKKATISTIGKLIKFTKEKNACYLCKQ